MIKTDNTVQMTKALHDVIWSDDTKINNIRSDE